MPSEWFFGRGPDAGAAAPPAVARPPEDERGLKSRIRQRILHEVDRLELARRGDSGAAVVRELAERVTREETAALPKLVRERILRDILSYLESGLGPLQPYAEDPEVTEIMVNRPDQCFVERAGRIVPVPVAFADDDEVRALVERLAAQVGRPFDLSHPMVDARLPDGSRLNAVMPPVSLLGTAVTIRKFPRPYTFEDLVRSGAVPEAVVPVLVEAVRPPAPGGIPRSVLVSGGTSSGKTTLLNALTGLIPEGERLVFCEDAAELQPQQAHIVRLETRPPTIEGENEITIRDLVRNALRMRPDRIIVGEVRGGEAFDMLQAMNTGHPGSLTTIHANGPEDALLRLESMVLQARLDMPERAIRQLIASALDLLVHVERVLTPAEGGLAIRRLVREVRRVTGFDSATGEIRTEPVWRWDEGGEA